MNVDWVIAVSVFLVFIGIGMASYWGLFETDSNAIGLSLDAANDKVLGFLEVDSWVTPVRYDSPGSGIEVLYLDFPWPEGTRNSTMITDSGLALDCMFQGDRLYFEAYVEPGDNEFLLTFANVSGPLACGPFVETANSNASLPGASEKSVMVSQSRVDQMLGTEYGQFRQALGITRNFRIEIDSGTTTAYGPSPPNYTNTYVRETHSSILGTGQPITIRVMVW
jgi:hypothetical protein